MSELLAQAMYAKHQELLQTEVFMLPEWEKAPQDVQAYWLAMAEFLLTPPEDKPEPTPLTFVFGNGDVLVRHGRLSKEEGDTRMWVGLQAREEGTEQWAVDVHTERQSVPEVALIFPHEEASSAVFEALTAGNPHMQRAR